jgi:hypothetical protein
MRKNDLVASLALREGRILGGKLGSISSQIKSRRSLFCVFLPLERAGPCMHSPASLGEPNGMSSGRKLV